MGAGDGGDDQIGAMHIVAGGKNAFACCGANGFVGEYQAPIVRGQIFGFFAQQWIGPVTDGQDNGVDFLTSWNGAPATCQQALFAGHGLAMDFDGNCRVGLEDLAVFINEWLSCVQPGVAGCDEPWLVE